LRNDEDAGRTTQLGAPDGNTEVITGGTSDIGFAAGGDDHTCTLYSRSRPPVSTA